MFDEFWRTKPGALGTAAVAASCIIIAISRVPRHGEAAKRHGEAEEKHGEASRPSAVMKKERRMMLISEWT